jgi:ribosomal protein S27AE
VSNFHRSTLKERLEFKASVKGFDRKQVNPAYTSQTCPRCGFLDARNRSGERFQCLKCGYAGSSDRVGALNIKVRSNDPEIKTWTPRAQIKTILQRRYYARLENLTSSDGDKVTVTGQTSGTKSTESSKGSGEDANAPSLGSSIAASAPVRHSKSKTAGGKSTTLSA